MPDPVWRPAVQGAVGYVVGLRSTDGATYACKVFGGDRARNAATEASALQLASTVLGDVAPSVVARGGLARHGVTYVLLPRLPGRRWGDRRPFLDDGERDAVVGAAAGVLRRLHAVPGPAFGPLLDGEPRWRSVEDRLDTLLDGVLARFAASGGGPALAADVRALVDDRRRAFSWPVFPVLCHLDLNGGNVLVAADGPPHLTGVVDFERAAWEDPMWDLALTATHLLHHEPERVQTLQAAYGGLDDADVARLEVYVVLRLVDERAWVATDRPAGWETSTARIEEMLRARV